MRRIRAWVRFRTNKKLWPIDENAVTPPDNWNEWPGGKRFAFILTHDVDTAYGQERVLAVAKLEEEMGFRSSFNFVPERYEVRENVRNYLTENNFEVGVHGLKHDGKYFISLERWQKRAKTINRYLKDWNSVGFRMPSVQYNLSWMHDLNIQYDSSTFDTDPFEPKPQGMRTIFPFWVPGINGRDGFVELPYTLPQDFTLYVILRQKNIDIWKSKLDWIASNGGMALMIVHPDYICPDGYSKGREDYPIAYYREYLEYVKGKYSGQYYHALPKEIALQWKLLYGATRQRME